MARKKTDPRTDIRRLTSDQARQLRLEWSRGATFKALGQKFGVSAVAAFYICRGQMSDGKLRKRSYAEPEAQPGNVA